MSRSKVSVTMDPGLLRVVDDYVHDHPQLDRSKVVEQALTLWLAERQDAAMAEQYSGDQGDAAELETWRSIRRAATTRRLRRA